MNPALGFKNGRWQRADLDQANQVYLARLQVGSNWFNTEAIGLTTTTASFSDYNEAGGWTCDHDAASLDFFFFRCGTAPAGPALLTVYHRPFATGVWAPTPIALSLGGTDTYTEADGTQLLLERGDQVALVNDSGGGIFISWCQLGAQLVPVYV